MLGRAFIQLFQRTHQLDLLRWLLLLLLLSSLLLLETTGAGTGSSHPAH